MSRVVLALLGLGLGTTACGSEPVPPAVAQAQTCALQFAHDPPPDDGSGVQFHCSTPIFAVDDIEASLAHYEQRLGFSVAWRWGEPATFAAVGRGNVQLFFCEGCQGQPQTWVSVFIDDVDQLHREYVERGATIIQPPTNHPWGMREMLVQDRDGHRLRLGHGLDQP